ncbi:MAG TPA: hemolysin III family protein [Acidimicrobiia bacterium]|nr:hemolysin III family protein [Acidimicrobiia bacterium]
MQRVSWGKMQNPIRGVLHGSAAGVSIVGLVFLLTRGGSVTVRGALAVYGLSLVALYTTSSLYHSVPWNSVWKARWQKLDHTLIYVLVAGTATPLLVMMLSGWWLLTGLLLLWGLAGMGAMKEFWPRTRKRWSLALQMVLGGFALVPVARMLVEMQPTAAALTLSGSVVYLGALAAFVRRRPVLAPRIFSYHEVFHVFVVVASVVHFLAVLQVVEAVGTV